MKGELAIVGAGRTGRTLGRLARLAGYRIGPVVCRTPERAREAAAFIGGGTPGTGLEGAALTIVAVPDAAISEVAAALRAPPGAITAHTCGSLGADALRPRRPAGAVHPLRSFADPAAAVERFAGTCCAVDGDAEAVGPLEELVRAIGGSPLRVRTDRKPLYHAGAVFASNYLVASLEAALELLGEAGVGRAEALAALLPLAESTLANVRAAGVPGALTGPVERGDDGTVRLHAKALEAFVPALVAPYAAMARLAIEAARAKGSIDGADAQRIEAALKETARR